MKNWVDWNWTNTLTWMATFNEKYNLNFEGGYTMERFQTYWLMGFKRRNSDYRRTIALCESRY